MKLISWTIIIISFTNNTVNDFIKAVKAEQYNQAVNRLAEVEDNFRTYNRLREGIIQSGAELQSQFAQVQKLDSDSTDASFLPFMFRFVFGIDAVPGSGILGAVDAQWNDAVGRMNDTVYAVLLRKYGGYETAINQGLVTDVSRYYSLESRVLDIYKLADTDTEEKNHVLKNPYDSYYALGYYAKKLTEESLRISNVYSQVQNTKHLYSLLHRHAELRLPIHKNHFQ